MKMKEEKNRYLIYNVLNTFWPTHYSHFRIFLFFMITVFLVEVQHDVCCLKIKISVNTLFLNV